MRVNLVLGIILIQLWQLSNATRQVFIVVNGQILNKKCSHLVTLHEGLVHLKTVLFISNRLGNLSQELSTAIKIFFRLSFPVSLVIWHTLSNLASDSNSDIPT